jgi:hypothetical protein
VVTEEEERRGKDKALEKILKKEFIHLPIEEEKCVGAMREFIEIILECYR